ncbi:MAG: endo-1,4-beta-xylanase [Coleofasciculaceae cyanobacterium]
MPKTSLLTRRRTLWLGLGAFAGLAASFKSKDIYRNLKLLALAETSKEFTVIGGDSLKKRAAAKGITYGAAGRYPDFILNPKLAARYAQECALLVPEWEFKWFIEWYPKWPVPNHPLRPSPESFDFTAADWMANFSQTHNLKFRGHTLVWHLSLPPWFKETVNHQNAEKFLVEHIQKVAGHYAGKMHSWDVVNEAINIYDGLPNNLQKTPWLEFLGADYIDIAYRAAAQADPNALLVYNDFGVEYEDPDSDKKKAAILRLLERLKSKGTPIHALGIQAHLDGSSTSGFTKLRKFLSEVASLGLQIMITELDVIDEKVPSDITVRDRIIANVYKEFLSVVLDEPAVKTVITWGLSDGYTYHTDFHARSDGMAVRPLPLDAELKPKLAWNAIASAFDSAPNR